MKEIFSEAEYESMLSKLFVRFPSFQKVGAGAYKPEQGIWNSSISWQGIRTGSIN